MSHVGHILVLDQDRRVRNAMTAVLRRHGWACASLADARHAVEVLRRDPPDVLVVDLAVDAYRRLLVRRRERRDRLPVVIATGRTSLTAAIAAVDQGAVAFLPKPVRTRDLLRNTRAALDKAQALRSFARVQHMLAVWTEWLHLLDAVLSAPGPAALPPGLLGSLGSRQRPPRPSTEGPEWATPARMLSPREQETLLALTSGLRPRQIARTLGVTIHTVRAHLKAAMKKLNVHSQDELLDRMRQPWLTEDRRVEALAAAVARSHR